MFFVSKNNIFFSQQNESTVFLLLRVRGKRHCRKRSPTVEAETRQVLFARYFNLLLFVL